MLGIDGKCGKKKLVCTKFWEKHYHIHRVCPIGHSSDQWDDSFLILVTPRAQGDAYQEFAIPISIRQSSEQTRTNCPEYRKRTKCTLEEVQDFFCSHHNSMNRVK